MDSKYVTIDLQVSVSSLTSLCSMSLSLNVSILDGMCSALTIQYIGKFISLLSHAITCWIL